MDALTIDQLSLFVLVARTGSFSAAARESRRAQSAVTYAIQKLEDQLGSELFDRSGYRPALTEAGLALLPRARRVLEEVDAFKVQARGLAQGVEAEISLVIDAMIPLEPIVRSLTELQEQFPSVQTRIEVQTLGSVAEAVASGTATIGVALMMASSLEHLDRTPLGSVQLVVVAAPSHPLASARAPLPAEQLREHVQLVLTDRSDVTAGRDYGVSATLAWRIADLGAKHAMLLAGLGWGSMPVHIVADDLASGRLAELKPESWDGEAVAPRLSTVLITRSDRALGPAGTSLRQALTTFSPDCDPIKCRKESR